VTNIPWEIVNILLGIEGKQSWLEIENVYDVWNAIKDNPEFDLVRFSIVKEYIEEMEREGFDYPSEIKEWFNEQLEDDCK
jgi:hypothetical protein